MAISAVSSSNSAPTLPANPFQQAFGQLTSAIQSGNLSAAQSAYATLSQAGGGDSNSPFAQALSQIGDALQAGDVGKAQVALATLQQQMQPVNGAHHHHGHHHHGGGAEASQSTVPAGSSNDPTSTSSTNLVDVVA